MFRCTACGAQYGERTMVWRCECGGALEYAGGRPPFPVSLEGRLPTMWRYREAFPFLDDRDVVTLGEGMTPIVKVEWRGFPVWLKLDFLCPTGSFKDRGASVMISAIKKAGITEVMEDSSGNAGASVAAYAARAGIGCTIYVPAANSPAKLAQISAYGARLVKVDGTRQHVADECRKAVVDQRNAFYASHNWNPLFIEGVKTVAYEIWEHFTVFSRDAGPAGIPDWVVVPSGYGSMALGVYRGFKDLFSWGRIDRMPRLVVVQAARCAPVYHAFLRGLKRVAPVDDVHTEAEGIACSKPIRGERILEAVADTGGLVVTVEEGEIGEAARTLAGSGIYVEPTSAVVPAAIANLAADGVVGPRDVVVGVLTGSGLKTGGVQ